jgi:CRISPR-associated protein Csd2
MLLAKTGCTEEDLDLLWESILCMYEHDRSASKGMMTCRGLYVFKHVGWDINEERRARQAFIGCARAQDLLDIGKVIDIKKNCGDKPPRSISDYDVIIDLEQVPKGVELSNTIQLKERLGL